MLLWAGVEPGRELRWCDGTREKPHSLCGFPLSQNMSEITQILREIRDGDQQAAEQLLALVYT